MDVITLIGQISQASSPFLLALAVWAFANGKVIPRWLYDESVKRETAVWALYEREKVTSERLLAERDRRAQQERPG